MPTRGFTADLSVFRAHLLTSPSIVKIWFASHVGSHLLGRQTHRTGRALSLLPGLNSYGVTGII